MNNSELVDLLKEHFPTKTEVNERFQKTDEQLVGLQREMNDRFKKTDEHLVSLHQELSDLRNEMRQGFARIHDSLDELKDSAGALDEVLEKYPIERIERLEVHAGLPPFVPEGVE